VRTTPLIAGLALAACFFTGSHLAAQEADIDETVAYTAWYAASQENDVAKAYQAAREYLEKYPSGQYADFLQKWAGQARGALFNQAIQAKDVDAIVRLGRERLAEEPNDLAYLVALALNLRRFELFAAPPVFAHADDAEEFSRKALDLIDAGQVPAGTDPAQFKKDETRAWLHQNLAILAARKEQPDVALEHYAKSSELDPANAGLNTYNSLMCGSLYKNRYDAAVARFQGLPEEARQASPLADEAQAVLDEANREADAAIECWARFAALSEAQGGSADLRTRITDALNALYAYRNPDNPEGAKELIDRHRPAN
jgi:hypothetical protein